MTTEDDTIVPQGWRDLNSTQRDILVALAQIGPANGVEINHALGGTDTTIGTINNNLGTLRGYGLVETTKAVDGYGPEKTNGLSDAGVELIWDAVVRPGVRIQNGRYGGEE